MSKSSSPPISGSESALLTARRRWDAFAKEGSSGLPHGTPLTIGVAASYTVQSLVPHLGAALLDGGFTPAITVAPYNQILRLCADLESVLAVAVDALVVLPRIEELAAASLRAYLGGSDQALDDGRAAATTLAAALADLRKRFSGTLVVGNLPWPEMAEVDALDLDGQADRFICAVRTAFDSELTSVPDVIRLDIAALQRDFGARRAFDPRTWYLFRQPYTEAFFGAMGTLTARVLAATRSASRKCLVLDADYTLWGGILGEDGINGIRLGDEFPGSVYRDLQLLALHWRRQGVFLAVVSKNNPDDVMDVFRRHDGMVLREDDISVFVVNWRPKSEAIAEVAQRLNIGVEALVFVDDSPYEIAEVSERHPEVLCIRTPSAPERIVAALRDARPFDRLEVTADDRARVDRIALEVKRESLRAELPETDFISRLELCVDTFPVDEVSIARVTQLVNKTNQFNITTPRLTAEEVRALAASERSILRAAKVVDRFGEYGLTCVGCATVAADYTWSLELFLMSCRVLGRGVESSFLADIAAEVVARGGRRLSARFVPTAKNMVCADFLPRHGFDRDADGVWWSDATSLAANRPAGRSTSAASGTWSPSRVHG
jgi:FkbH-like protein